MNFIIQRFIREHKIAKTNINNLYANPNLLTNQGKYVNVLPTIQPVVQVEPVSRTIRGHGEILLESENIAIAGTTAAYTSRFETKGYRFLFMIIQNPAWTTNPTSILVAVRYTNDNGATEYLLYGYDGSPLYFNISPSDGINQAYFIPVSTLFGTLATGDSLGFAPIPNVNSNHKIRLSFTPAGTAESKSITVMVFGV